MDPSERELTWLRRVRDLSLRLASERELDQVLPLILDAAIELTEAERGYLVRVRRKDTSTDIEVVEARGFDKASLSGEPGAVSRTVVQRVLEREEEGLITTSEGDADVLDATSVKDRRVLSIACVPLRLRGETLGVLYLDHRFREGAFQDRDLAPLKVFATQAALALETATLLAGIGEGATSAAPDLAELEALRSHHEGESPDAPSLKQFGGLIGASPALGALYEDVERAARGMGPVLVLGEPGTDLETVAREVHARSARAEAPFVAVRCAAAEPQALSSELLGHIKNAFPWATTNRRGAFVLAGKGTLFLDDVNELDPSLQAALLRVIRDQEIAPLGGRPRSVSCRVIVASADLWSPVQRHAFRQDLYYQLDVLRLTMPPLRQRLPDVPALIPSLLQKLELPMLKLTDHALSLLKTYCWPGNDQELRNELQRLAALGKAQITSRDLSPEIQEGRGVSGASSALAGKTLDEVNREMIAAAVRDTKGNKTRAARQLGIPRSTLYGLLERYGLDD